MVNRARPSSADPEPGSDLPPGRIAPSWLADRLRAAAGGVPFATYMDWALHDPEHGAYGSGRLRIGPGGDFATSPSLGPVFAELLAPQLAEWLLALGDGPLALIETGPGEGQLAAQLVASLLQGWPELVRRLELVLVEPNPGMERRQRLRLGGLPLPVRWCGFDSLGEAPLRGVMLAHEVLDALAVERIVWTGSDWREQWVALRDGSSELELVEGAAPTAWALAELERLGLAGGRAPAGDPLPAGWCSELHPAIPAWLRGAAESLIDGRLLIIDYALEAHRYYASRRSSGTLMAYRGQQACGDPLLQCGHWDITAHLCLDSLQDAASSAGWSWLGSRRQGEALLALGLAQALHALQDPGATGDLPELLARREALLRLVDPAGLGDFRWIALARSEAAASAGLPLFLRDPAPH